MTEFWYGYLIGGFMFMIVNISVTMIREAIK